MSLTKLYINSKESFKMAHYKIQNKLNNDFNGFVIIDCFDRLHFDINKKYIPQYFNNNLVFISANSFQQSHSILSIQIRKYIDQQLIFNNITCIGGESYLYGLTNNIIDKIYFYTNSQSIYSDSIYNNKIYNKSMNNYLVDYNKIDYIIESDICLINLSKLNNNLMKLINKSKIIIIISCHHDDFWNKIKILTKYKLETRKFFICDKLKYFITVNIFKQKREYVSLGGNCSVAYQLKKLNKRNYSYPFDWCNITLNQLIDVFNNDFKDFEKLSIKKLSENHIEFESGNPSYILTNCYNIKFAHELINSDDINILSEKIKRRIIRIKQLINPIFIRIEINNLTDLQISKYNKLINQLDELYNNYDFILIANKNPNIDKIKYYKLNDFSDDWKYELLNWNIFL